MVSTTTPYMSFPFLQTPPPPPPLPPQQNITVYPNPPFTQSSSSHHSAGSFGTAFLVLAVVVVVSAIACCLGQLCNRARDQRLNHPEMQKPGRENFNRGHRGDDVEFGFQRRDRGLNKPDQGVISGQGEESRSEISSVKTSDMDGANLRGDDVEPKGPPAWL